MYLLLFSPLFSLILCAVFFLFVHKNICDRLKLNEKNSRPGLYAQNKRSNDDYKQNNA